MARARLEPLEQGQWLTALITSEDQGSLPVSHVVADNHP